MNDDPGRPMLVWGGLVGFASGGIVDVVVFHLVFQHHHLLSGVIDPTTEAGLRANIVYDGLFLVLLFAVLALGLGMLWRQVNGHREPLSTTYLLGAAVLGAGVFNILDGIVSHYLLGIHNVVHGTTRWNPHWVIVSVVLLVLGAIVIRLAGGPVARGRRSESE